MEVDGALEGSRVGRNDGKVVGLFVGFIEGEFVENIEGSKDGATEGESVGRVGDIDGLLVTGVTVGSMVGTLTGI